MTYTPCLKQRYHNHRQFCWNLAHSSRINFPQNHATVFHLTWITSLLYLVKLEMFTCYRSAVRERNSGIDLTSTTSSKFARFESSWLQHVQERFHKTHHWSGQTARATMEWVKSLWQLFVGGVVACQRASRPAVDILSIVSDSSLYYNC